jgi:hypothetical protein
MGRVARQELRKGLARQEVKERPCWTGNEEKALQGKLPTNLSPAEVESHVALA